MPHPKLLTAFGKTQSMADWARERNIPYRILKDRLRPRTRGWSVEEALTRDVSDGMKKDRQPGDMNCKGMKKFRAWVGEKIGRLMIVEYVPGRGRGYKDREPMFVCSCVCGTENYRVSPYNLLYADREDIGCGCVHSERMAAMNVANATHGMSGTPEYKVWVAMKGRCYTLSATGYENYGGRGISVCDRWRESFENFYEDMGPRPSDNHSIERRDNDGNYDPGNCVWATMDMQANNKRSTVRVAYDGEIMSLKQWCSLLGISDQSARKLMADSGVTFREAAEELLSRKS